MSRFTPRTADDLTLGLLAAVRARTSLSDVRSNGPLGQIAQQTGAQLARGDASIGFLELLHDIDNLVGDELDARAAMILPDGLLRGGATRAAGSLRWSRDTAAGALTVSAGSRASTTVNGRLVYYYSTTDATFGALDLVSSAVAAVCAETGVIGNVGAMDLSIGSATVGVNAVETLTGFTDGLDQQSDADFREAIRTYVRGLGGGHDDGVLAAVAGATSGDKTVKHVRILDGPGRGDSTADIVIDDGAGTAGETAAQIGGTLLAAAYGGERELQLPHYPISDAAAPVITVVPAHAGAAIVFRPWGRVRLFQDCAAGDAVTFAGYNYYTGLVAEVQKILDGDPSDRTNYPGVRGVGSAMLAARPATVNWIGTAVAPYGGTLIFSGYDNADALKALCDAAVVGYVNSLGIGAAYYRSAVIAAVMAVSGVLSFIPDDTDESKPVAFDGVHRTSLDRVDLTYGV